MNNPSGQNVTHCNLLKFQCDQKWDSLTQTRDPRIQFCEQCKEAVYLCSSETEFRRHAANHHCVALASSVWPNAESGGRSSPAFHIFFCWEVIGRPGFRSVICDEV